MIKKLIRILSSSLANVKTYVGEDGKLHFIDGAGADTVLNFSSVGINSLTCLSSSYTGTTIPCNVKKGKLYLLFTSIRSTGGGAITYSGGDVIFNTNQGTVAKDLSYWQHFHIAIIKATSTSIVTTYSGYKDEKYSTYFIYEIN